MTINKQTKKRTDHCRIPDFIPRTGDTVTNQSSCYGQIFPRFTIPVENWTLRNGTSVAKLGQRKTRKQDKKKIRQSIMNDFNIPTGRWRLVRVCDRELSSLSEKLVQLASNIGTGRGKEWGKYSHGNFGAGHSFPEWLERLLSEAKARSNEDIWMRWTDGEIIQLLNWTNSWQQLTN